MRPEWQKPNGQHELNQNELHLWWIPLKVDESQASRAIGLLTDAQQNRLKRLPTQTLKDAFLASRFHALDLLAKYNSCEIEDISFKYNRLNKASLKHNPFNIQFNYTDTTFGNTSHALFAFCKDLNVGVDIERLHRTQSFEKLARKRFTESEQSYVRDSEGFVIPQKCLAMWTRKESFGKAMGVGINYKMSQVTLVNEESHELDFEHDNTKWRLQQIQLDEDMISCVVHESHRKLKVIGFKK